MASSAPPPSGPSSSGEHLTTIGHGGRFWEVYMEFDDDPRTPETCRARLCFVPADGAEEEEPARTATIIIEDSYEAAMRKARSFADPQLQALLRSTLPD